MYAIQQMYLPTTDSDRPNKPLTPIGWVVHSTATPNAPDENIATYFATHDADASCHYAVDWDSITAIIPECEMAYHAGYQANIRFLSVEMCETDDPVKFAEVWKRTVWLLADSCQRHCWSPDVAIHSHLWASNTYKETNHTDPYDFFKQHGKTMEDLLRDVKKQMEKRFSDVEDGYWAKDIIEAIADAGLMQGYPDGTFKPDQPVTRAELAAVLKNLTRKG